MSNWKKFAVNIQNIKRETEKAVLIAMPHKSDYDGYQFWFPKKLVREGSHSYERSVSIADDMNVTLKKVSDKTFKVLDEKTISADEIISVFGEFKGYTKPTKELKPEIVIHTPARLEPDKREADAALIR